MALTVSDTVIATGSNRSSSGDDSSDDDDDDEQARDGMPSRNQSDELSIHDVRLNVCYVLYHIPCCLSTVISVLQTRLSYLFTM